MNQLNTRFRRTALKRNNNVIFNLYFSSFKIKQAQDEERRQLTQLRDILKSALQVDQKEVSLWGGLTLEYQITSNVMGVFEIELF